jgi:hypothetical protein
MVKLYYDKFSGIRNCSPLKLQERMERAMEQMRKDHYSTFYKHLLICDPFLDVDFLRQIQVHYDINLKLEMLIEKL